MNCWHCSKPIVSKHVRMDGWPRPLRLHVDCAGPFAQRIIVEALKFHPPVRSLGTPMVDWVRTEAEKRHVVPQAIYHRIIRNQKKYYPNIHLTRINKRVVFVSERAA